VWRAASRGRGEREERGRRAGARETRGFVAGTPQEKVYHDLPTIHRSPKAGGAGGCAGVRGAACRCTSARCRGNRSAHRQGAVATVVVEIGIAGEKNVFVGLLAVVGSLMTCRAEPQSVHEVVETWGMRATTTRPQQTIAHSGRVPPVGILVDGGKRKRRASSAAGRGEAHAARARQGCDGPG
jgi:hypothetical protein